MKKLFLTVILSLVFVFGIFSLALAVTDSDPTYTAAIDAANTAYNIAFNTAFAIKTAAIVAAEATYEAVLAANATALSLPAADPAHIAATAALNTALATKTAAIATAITAYNIALNTALATKTAAIAAARSAAGAAQSQPLQSGCKIDPTTSQVICSLENPLAGNKTEATQIIATVIKTALGIIGALTLLMLVWGGFQWLTSAGNPEKVKSGTQTMVWAIIGVILVFASYILLSTFTDYLTGTA